MTFVQRGRCTVVVGGQFGSEGKGLAAGWMASTSFAPDYAVTNAGAQAGHTTVLPNGEKFVTYHLPTFGVMAVKGQSMRAPHDYSKPDRTVSYVCGGSIIDPAQFEQELKDCGVPRDRVVIHPRAAVITPEAKAEERDAASSTARLASTQKGVGATIAAKVMRRARLAKDFFDTQIVDLNAELRRGASVTLEIPQGTGLSINHGAAYPHCTSRDCWVASGLNDAGIHPHFLGDVMMVVRTFPIRVGNLTDDDGNVIGESGPFYEGSFELDWAKHFPGVEPERTTVTKRVRRIATWSDVQYRHSLELNRPNVVLLNFVNYFQTFAEFEARVKAMKFIHDHLGLQIALYFGLGPKNSDVVHEMDHVEDWFKKNR